MWKGTRANWWKLAQQWGECADSVHTEAKVRIERRSLELSGNNTNCCTAMQLPQGRCRKPTSLPTHWKNEAIPLSCSVLTFVSVARSVARLHPLSYCIVRGSGSALTTGHQLLLTMHSEQQDIFLYRNKEVQMLVYQIKDAAWSAELLQYFLSFCVIYC